MASINLVTLERGLVRNMQNEQELSRERKRRRKIVGLILFWFIAIYMGSFLDDLAGYILVDLVGLFVVIGLIARLVQDES